MHLFSLEQRWLLDDSPGRTEGVGCLLLFLLCLPPPTTSDQRVICVRAEIKAT